MPTLSPESTSPTVTPTPVATPTPIQASDAKFPEAPDRDLYELARSLLLKSSESIPPVAKEHPVSYEEGREDTFWVTDIPSVRVYTTQAILLLVSPHAYWYMEEGVDISRKDLEKAAGIFEGEIYPRLTAAFGTEWTPGVDNDPHLTILHARLRGVDGYFSSSDEYPLSVHRHSNEREIIYMSHALNPDSRHYLGVLAHELQHAIHWNGDSGEETWVNEGISEVAKVVAGYRPSFQNLFLNSPTVSLVNWPDHIGRYYGAAFLFFEYLAAHYGGRDHLGLLVREPSDGILGIDHYLSGLGFDVTFRDVFKDWAIANYLDQPDGGPYSYPDKDVKVRVAVRMREFGARQSSIPQYSSEYTAIDIIKGDVRVRFQGQEENSLLPISLDGRGCWWSNRGDSISSTLTRSLDLSDVDTTTLRFRTWFDIEEDWDYAYVEVSTDQGSTWDIIEAPGTSPGNPVGNSFGPGYTGSSGGWLPVEVDLTPYAGQPVLLRFHYVTDDAINHIGLCFDDISVPEIGFSDGGGAGDGWQAEGFLLIDNVVPQEYIVQVIEVGNETRVREMKLGEENNGELVIRAMEELDDVVLVVSTLAPKTIQEASYTLTLEPAS